MSCNIILRERESDLDEFKFGSKSILHFPIPLKTFINCDLGASQSYTNSIPLFKQVSKTNHFV